MADIDISVNAEVSRARAALDSVKGSVDGIARTTKSGSGVLKGFLGGSAITAAVGAAASGLRSLSGVVSESVGEARESAKVGATTNAIIKATGGAAKISAGQVGDLATAISNKTGVDDEAVQKGSNLLLTFKNVRNEVGKGSAVFDRASAAAVDLSSAGFGSIEGSSKMLGKALNDPVKGISALSRAGVTFTDQQKKQITAMTEAGDVLGAQKIILGEVESQVGGVAAANASAGEKAAVMAGNLKEQFGTILLPYLDKFATFFTSTLGPAISSGLEKIGPVIGRVVTFVQAGIAQAGPLIARIQTFIAPVVTAVRGLFAAFAGGQGGGGLAALQALGAGISAAFSAVAPIVRQIVTTIAGVLAAALPTVKAALTDLGGALTAVASIVTSVWARIGPTVLPIVKAVFTAVIGVVGGAVKVISGVVKLVAAVLRGDWGGAWKAAQQIAAGAVAIVKSLVTGMAKIIGAAVKGAASAVGAAWAGIKSASSAAWGAIKSGVSSAWSAVKASTSAAWAAVKSAVSSKLSEVVALVRALPGRARSALGNAASALYSAGADLVRGFANGISGAVGIVVDRARGIANSAINAAKSALGIASPSRVFAQLGQYVGAGFAKGLHGSERQVSAATTALSKKVASTFLADARARNAAILSAAKSAKAAQDAQIRQIKNTAARRAADLRADTAYAAKRKRLDREADARLDRAAKSAARFSAKIEAQGRRVAAAAKARDAAAARLKAGQAKLAEAVKVRADYAANVTAAARQFASLTSIQAQQDKALTSADLTRGLADKLRAVQAFAYKLAQLRRSGLNQASYDQLVQAGVEGGAAAVDALYSDQSAIARVNALQESISGATRRLGTAAGSVMYDAGVRVQQGLVNGLAADSRKLDQAADRLADQLVKRVKKKLGIRSPSRVFAELGQQTIRGLGLGLDPAAVGAQGERLAGALVRGFDRPQLDAQLAGGAGGRSYTINVTVPLSSSRAEVGREVVDAIRAYERAGGRR